MRHYDEVPQDPVEIPEGARVWLGVDLSKSQDLSAVVVVHPKGDETIELEGHYWYPEEHAREREIMYAAPFRTWRNKGILTLTPGRNIPWEPIRERINELCKRYNVQQIAVDPWASSYFIETLEGQDGLPVVGHLQSMAHMAPATQEWQNIWVARRFRHGGDPILRMCCANATVWEDNNGNIRPIKDAKRGLIDALIAGIMGVHAWAESVGEGPSMYEMGVGV